MVITCKYKNRSWAVSDEETIKRIKAMRHAVRYGGFDFDKKTIRQVSIMLGINIKDDWLMRDFITNTLLDNGYIQKAYWDGASQFGFRLASRLAWIENND